jgi:hypothetical protein
METISSDKNPNSMGGKKGRGCQALSLEKEVLLGEIKSPGLLINNLAFSGRGGS